MILEVKYYRVYNFTTKKLIMRDFYTKAEAEYFIKKYDTECREGRRKRKDYIATVVPYTSKYLIIEMVGTVNSEIVKDWKEGVIEELELKDL